MNIILFAPALFLLLVVETGAVGAAWRIGLCGAIQVALGLPFLMTDSKGYLGASFNLSRVFKHKWSVNFRWVPCTPLPPEEEQLLVDCTGLFTSKVFGLGLLGLMVLLLGCFGHARWCQARGGLWKTIWGSLQGQALRGFTAKEIVTMLFCSNFIGVACARSLHFQFYVWYYHSLPWLLWHGTRLPTVVRLLLLGGIELCWNPWAGESSSPESAVSELARSLLSLMRRRTISFQHIMRGHHELSLYHESMPMWPPPLADMAIVTVQALLTACHIILLAALWDGLGHSRGDNTADVKKPAKKIK